MPRAGGLQLDDRDVLSARPFRTLTGLERDVLSLAQTVEVCAGGLVKEVFVAVFRRDETEAFVADETLDRTVDSCHVSDS